MPAGLRGPAPTVIHARRSGLRAGRQAKPAQALRSFQHLSLPTPTPPMSRPSPRPRSDFRYFLPIDTRWMDNDVYGHVNNVTYYSYFDTAVNRYLIDAGALDIAASPVIGLVVETGCQYFSSIAFPDRIEAAVRVARLGNSSVRYEVGIFREGEPLSAAHGHFVHVYVDRQSRRPASLPAVLRRALEPLAADGEDHEAR
jgi:acyl-CoA thioester hydrolase